MFSVGKHLVRQIKMAPMIKHISFNLASYYNFIYTGWKSIMEVNCLHLCLSIWSLFRISVYIRQDVSMWTVPSCFPGRVAVTWLETWSNVNVSLLDKILCKKNTYTTCPYLHNIHALQNYYRCITAWHRCGDLPIVLYCNLQLIAVWRLFLSVPSTAGQLPIWSQTYRKNTAKWQEIPLWTTPNNSNSTEDAFKTRPWACYIRVQSETSTKCVYFSRGQEKESKLWLK